MLAAMSSVLLVVLTYFLMQGTSINAPHHERSDVLQAVILYHAALQRDVLRGRAGLLPNYDTLVESTDSLRAAVADLPTADEVATGAAERDIERKTAEIDKAVVEQEALVESFKSENALLQNSLSYFNHLGQRLTSGRNGGPAWAADEIGAVAAAMLRFINAPRQELEHEVANTIDALERSTAPVSAVDDVRSLVSHARVIARTLPAVDDLVARIQSAPLGDLARELQGAYLALHARESRRANVFMSLLYGVAIALMGYIAYLFARLRANRDQLEERLELERLVAGISTRFINLPCSGVVLATHEVLGQLASHLRVSGAELALEGPDGVSSPRPDSGGGTDRPPADRLAELIRRSGMEGNEVQGCLHVPDVARLPDGEEKAALTQDGIRSLLAIPMDMAGECLGAVILTDTRPRRWRSDDIALLRTVVDVFANTIIRCRSESEREDLQLRLNRSQRLEAIGTLAGGIAHEFNNILGAIRGYGEMTLSMLLADSRARRHVTQILKAGERAQEIVEQVLAFGRRRKREQGPIDVRTVIAEAIEFVRASLPRTLSLHAELTESGAVVLGDPTELQQVVVNLATNAGQAMNQTGALRIDLDTVSVGHALGLSHGALQAGRHVRLRVTDSGPGIEPAVMERIFEPFFTTKPAGQGTGLGLSTVYGIVTAHRGAIDVASKPGEGATFSVYLPQIDAEVGPETGDGGPIPQGHGQTILIVEDDESLLLLGEEMLAALGYEPVGFDHGQAALAAFCARPERFDLALIDEVMPEASGTELAGAVHNTRPDIPIVLMTEHGGTLGPEGLPSAGIREILKKPLVSMDLGACLARQLADKPAPLRRSWTTPSRTRPSAHLPE
ncbi:MAG: two-component system VirA-like sensor kinase [Lautropia sp.]